MMRRGAIVASMIFGLAACTNEPTPAVTLEQARASFCPHVVSILLAMSRQPLSDGGEPDLERDAELYAAAGHDDAARKVRDLVTALEDNRRGLRIFLEDGARIDQVEAIEDELQALEGVEDVGFISKEEAYAQFLEMFEGQSSVIDAADPDALPASFEVTFIDGFDPSGSIAELGSQPGVRKVIQGRLDAARALSELTPFIAGECPNLSEGLGGAPG